MKIDRKLPILAALLLAASTLAGCRDAPSAANIQWQIEHHLPGIRLERESHVRIPRAGMMLARKIVRWAGEEDEEDLRMLSHVKRVNVATYRVLESPGAETLEGPLRFEDRLADSGWELMVRQREDDEHTWLFYRPGEAGAITHLYVVTLDDYELVVVDLAGRIDRIVAEALAEEPGELVEIFG